MKDGNLSIKTKRKTIYEKCGGSPLGSGFTLQSFWTLRDPKRIYATIPNPLTPELEFLLMA
jgi:hypothetical protein